MRTPLSFALGLCALTVGCSSTAPLPDSTPVRGAPQSSSSRSSVITLEELETAANLDAFEAVRRLRPMWLRTRGPVSMLLASGIMVYVNGSRRGFAQELRGLRATNIEKMEFLDSRQATVRFGVDHPDGAILVTLRGG